MDSNERHNLIDRLQGFDDEELLRDMTDGLDHWCDRRRQRARNAKRVVVVALMLLTTTAIALTAVPLLRKVFQESSEETPSRSVPTTVQRPQAAAEETPPHVVVRAEELPQPVDYHYTGIAEEGYSVAYGHDSRTLTYTRYSGNHLISSVIHDAPELLFSDTVGQVGETIGRVESETVMPAASKSVVPCDFQVVGTRGDAYYCTVVDSLNRLVSLRGDVAEWMGQRICYCDTLLVPATVEHDGESYTVTMLSDSAFSGHGELKAVVLPSTLRHIGDMAFANCSGLNYINVLAEQPPTAEPTSFDRTDAHLLLIVPCGTAMAYADDMEWIYFRNMIEACDAANRRSPHIRVMHRE